MRPVGFPLHLQTNLVSGTAFLRSPLQRDHQSVLDKQCVWKSCRTSMYCSWMPPTRIRSVEGRISDAEFIVGLERLLVVGLECLCYVGRRAGPAHAIGFSLLFLLKRRPILSQILNYCENSSRYVNTGTLIKEQTTLQVATTWPLNAVDRS